MARIEHGERPPSIVEVWPGGLGLETRVRRRGAAARRERRTA